MSSNTQFAFILIGIVLGVMVLGLGLNTCTKNTSTDNFDYNLDRRVEKYVEFGPKNSEKTHLLEPKSVDNKIIPTEIPNSGKDTPTKNPILQNLEEDFKDILDTVRSDEFKEDINSLKTELKSMADLIKKSIEEEKQHD